MFDVFISGNKWEPVDNPKDSPRGQYHSDGRTTIRVDAAKQLKTALHCLVTEEQLAQLVKDKVPFTTFEKLSASEKHPGSRKCERGAPLHVFGRQIVSPPDRGGKVKTIRPGSAKVF